MRILQHHIILLHVVLPFSRLNETKEDRLSALVNNLKAPINAYGLTLKQHLVQTFIPAAKQLKAIHIAIESKVDVPYESGLLLFHDATRKLEDLAIREEDELKEVYAKTQASFPLGPLENVQIANAKLVCVIE